MARKRDPARDAARELWEKSGKAAKLKDIAEQLGKQPSQVRKWKSEDHWEQEHSKGSAPIEKERSLSHAVPRAVAKSTAPEKQKKFVMLYLQRFNATWAYMKAYGADYQTAAAAGSRLLGNVKVAAMIDELKAEQAAELHMTQMDVLQDLAKQARADIGDYVEFGSDAVVELKDGKPTGITYQVDRVHLKDQSEVDTSLVKSVAIDKGFVKLELYDKQKAMDMLLKNLPDAAIKRRADADADVAEMQRDEMRGVGYKNPLMETLAKDAAKLKPEEMKHDADKPEQD
ncbi:terminase small subunit [Lacticaseibacillus suilingensis]|uniref:terminase small subunit n=1 Tax=Lacticaseibacillus suilingensis TaxID=2799577 RepID=UPI0022E04903|nr:terminase small subunit [Lacticaseibacillus suilingensis]